MHIPFFICVLFFEESCSDSLESGDEMYFPALQDGEVGKTAVVCLVPTNGSYYYMWLLLILELEKLVLVFCSTFGWINHQNMPELVPQLM